MNDIHHMCQTQVKGAKLSVRNILTITGLMVGCPIPTDSHFYCCEPNSFFLDLEIAVIRGPAD